MKAENITVEFHCPNLAEKEKKKVENDVKEELVSQLSFVVKKLPNHLIVSLFEVPRTKQLVGTAKSEEGEIIIKEIKINLSNGGRVYLT